MKIETLKVLTLAGFLWAGGTQSVWAQNYLLHTKVISGGGGTSGNASLALTGSIGQWATGTLKGGTLAVKAGVWSTVITAFPVAGDLTIERYPHRGTKVPLATLLADDSDADGRTLTLAFSPTSAEGAHITMGHGWVFYTPPVELTNEDSFAYTVTDGFGASATGTVTVEIFVDGDPGHDLIISKLGGSFLFNGHGIPGYTYILQYSDTTEPFVWQNLPGGSVVADSAGMFEVAITPGAQTVRFYRWIYQ